MIPTSQILHFKLYISLKYHYPAQVLYNTCIYISHTPASFKHQPKSQGPSHPILSLFHALPFIPRANEWSIIYLYLYSKFQFRYNHHSYHLYNSQMNKNYDFKSMLGQGSFSTPLTRHHIFRH